MSQLDKFLQSAEALLERVERLLPVASDCEPDWAAAIAWRWRGAQQRPGLQAITRPHGIGLTDILCMEQQKLEIDRNTRQFIANLPANNVLLWGARGTGKSSLIKALLNEYAEQGLRLVEVDKQHLIDLPDILNHLYQRPEKFILFCDDLSFEADDPSYKALKAALDGSLSVLPDNVLIYATSNRRHLLPEFHRDNLEASHYEGEIHHGESVEEKISLSERFGLWLAFHPFTQDQYLSVLRAWAEKQGVNASEWNDEIRVEALRWALKRGSRSGRVAWQFARDWSGRLQLEMLADVGEVTSKKIHTI